MLVYRCASERTQIQRLCTPCPFFFLMSCNFQISLNAMFVTSHGRTLLFWSKWPGKCLLTEFIWHIWSLEEILCWNFLPRAVAAVQNPIKLKTEQDNSMKSIICFRSSLLPSGSYFRIFPSGTSWKAVAGDETPRKASQCLSNHFSYTKEEAWSEWGEMILEQLLPVSHLVQMGKAKQILN